MNNINIQQSLFIIDGLSETVGGFVSRFRRPPHRNETVSDQRHQCRAVPVQEIWPVQPAGLALPDFLGSPPAAFKFQEKGYFLSISQSFCLENRSRPRPSSAVWRLMPFGNSGRSGYMTIIYIQILSEFSVFNPFF